MQAQPPPRLAADYGRLADEDYKMVCSDGGGSSSHNKENQAVMVVAPLLGDHHDTDKEKHFQAPALIFVIYL